ALPGGGRPATRSLLQEEARRTAPAAGTRAPGAAPATLPTGPGQLAPAPQPAPAPQTTPPASTPAPAPGGGR
ncbi:MAG: hypothetical protein ABIP29_02190, partial [Candidatus Eisenbacteria bacterium]